VTIRSLFRSFFLLSLSFSLFILCIYHIYTYMRPYTRTRASLCHNVASRSNIAILLFFFYFLQSCMAYIEWCEGKRLQSIFYTKSQRAADYRRRHCISISFSIFFPFISIDERKNKKENKKKKKTKTKRSDVRVTKYIVLNRLNQMLDYLENMRKATRTIHDWLMLFNSSSTTNSVQ